MKALKVEQAAAIPKPLPPLNTGVNGLGKLAVSTVSSGSRTPNGSITPPANVNRVNLSRDLATFKPAVFISPVDSGADTVTMPLKACTLLTIDVQSSRLLVCFLAYCFLFNFILSFMHIESLSSQCCWLNHGAFETCRVRLRMQRCCPLWSAMTLWASYSST